MKQNESRTLPVKQVTSKPSFDDQSSRLEKSDRDEPKHGAASPKTGHDHPTLNSQKGLRRQWISSIIASLAYIIVGTSLGWPSPVLHFTRQYHKPVNLSHSDAALMVSLFYAGNVVMPIPSGMLSDWVGRKYSLLYLTFLPLASWILIWAAGTAVGDVGAKAMIHIARFLMGMYSGLALTVLPIYLGEIAEPKIRGALASLLQLFTNIGLVISYAVGMSVSYGTFAIILGVLPIVYFFLLLLIPKSPYWLIMKGKDGEASKHLAWLRGGEVGSKDVEEEANNIARSVNADKIKPKTFKMLFTTNSYRKAMIIVEVLSASQRFSGISAIMAYVSITLPEIPEYGLTANIGAILTGFANILGVLIALPLVDRLGRIPLMIISCFGCAVAMLLAAVWYYIYNQDIQGALWKWVPLTVFCMYGIFMNLGLGPIPALVQGEMFPSHLKGKASAITVMVLAASSTVVNFSYIPIADAAGYWCDFLIYTLICIACLIFTWTYAFETKGKSLPEIQRHLSE